MDIKTIQLDFSYFLPREHREVVKLIKQLGFKIDLNNYQDYNFFRYCEAENQFKFFNEVDEKLEIYSFKEFTNAVKNNTNSCFIISDKEYKSLLNHYKQIGEILNNFKPHRK